VEGIPGEYLSEYLFNSLFGKFTRSRVLFNSVIQSPMFALKFFYRFLGCLLTPYCSAKLTSVFGSYFLFSLDSLLFLFLRLT